MPIDLGQFKKKENKIIPGPGDKKKDQNLPDKKVARAQPKKADDFKLQQMQFDNKKAPDIDQKINEIVNERILKLVSIGLKHELTIENMTRYFRETRKLKLYNLVRYFSDANPGEVNEMLQYLHKTGILSRDQNNWYSLK